MSRPRRNYGELSQDQPVSVPAASLSAARERSRSPHLRSPTPLLDPSNPARSRTPRPRSPDGGSQPSPPVNTGRRTAGVPTLPSSPAFPPNLSKARKRIVSNSSIASSSMTDDSTDSVEPYLLAPTVYLPGFAPLESCLPIYPVLSAVLSFLTTKDILPLYGVSKTFKGYLESTYISHWNEISFCKERQWIGSVYTPRTAKERVELDAVYKHLRLYVFWKIEQEQKVLRKARELYDNEVAFILNRELYMQGEFVSGGRRSIEQSQAEQAALIPKHIFDGAEFAYAEVAVRVETTRPRVFFDKDVDGAYIRRVLLHVKAQMGRTMMPGSERPFQFVKSLVLDGAHIRLEELIKALELVADSPSIEGLSARGCGLMNLTVWARCLESRPKVLEKLKWLKIYPSEHFPRSPFHYDAASSLIAQYRRPLAQHPPHVPVFPGKLTLQQHLDILMPLLISNDPYHDMNDMRSDFMQRRTEALQKMRARLRFEYDTQQLRNGRWLSGPYLTRLHPALKILALGKAMGIKVNFNLCGAGVKCSGWRVVESRREANEMADDENAQLNALARGLDMMDMGTHVIGSRARAEKKGTQRCGCCGEWEWDDDARSRKPGWLIKALGLGKEWTLASDGWVFSEELLKKGIRVELKVEFHEEVPIQEPGERVDEETRCRKLLGVIGGVRMPTLVKRTRRYVTDNSGRRGQFLVEDAQDEFNWPPGCGAGGVCEDCETNLTCWGCGKFYCQLCMFIPDPRPGIVRSRPPLHLDVLCVERKHGPLCIDCRPKLNTTCSGCKGRFCDICFPGGIVLEKFPRHDNPYIVLPDDELDDVWETWDGLDADGLEMDRIGRDEEEPPSDEEDADDLPTAEEIAAASALRDEEVVTWGGPGEEVAATVGEIVRQLEDVRLKIGNMEIVTEDLDPAELPVGHYDDSVGTDDMDSMDMNLDEGDFDQAPPSEASDMDSSSESSSNDDDDPNAIIRAATAHPGQPTLGTYAAPPPHYPSYQASLISSLKLTKPPLSDGDFNLTTHTPVQMYTTCTFCTKTLCAVCTKGHVNAFGRHWDWDRCAGCGGVMCPDCCARECNTCQRGLCAGCYAGEVAQLDTAPPPPPAATNPTRQPHTCYRCHLRQTINAAKRHGDAQHPPHLRGLPMDGYGNLIPASVSKYDPRPGLEACKAEFRREFDVRRGALVGVLNANRGGVEELLDGTAGRGGRVEMGLLCQGVSEEFHEGRAGVCMDGWREMVQERARRELGSPPAGAGEWGLEMETFGDD